jgi:TRAP-type mannitol/chloroaromatic compound transport system permease large subunit
MTLAIPAALIFLLMLATMLVGMPIAVSMAAVGILGGIAAFGGPFIDSIAPVVWGTLNENLLTCVPLFVLLGELLLRSGIADRMYTALSAWLGGLPGGLLHTNIGACALFAATSGSSSPPRRRSAPSRCRRCTRAGTRCAPPSERWLRAARSAS